MDFVFIMLGTPHYWNHEGCGCTSGSPGSFNVVIMGLNWCLNDRELLLFNKYVDPKINELNTIFNPI